MTNNKPNDHIAELRLKYREFASPRTYQQADNDENSWRPNLDKASTGSAIIRFLPARVGEAFPHIKTYRHAFKAPSGKWFIEACPKTIGLPCPACIANEPLWKRDKAIATLRKAKLTYVSNILVINDPKHPENNGKVFLFKYGVKIFSKIKDLVDPPAEFEDMEPCDPIDPEFGANFKLRITKQDDFLNYDKSSFDKPSAIGDAGRIKEVLSQLHSLDEILDPKNYKSFDALQKRFELVVGTEQEPLATGTIDDDLPIANTSSNLRVVAAAPQRAATTTRAAGKRTAEPNGDDFFADLTKMADFADQK